MNSKGTSKAKHYIIYKTAITKQLLQTKLVEAALRSVQTYTKHSTHKAKKDFISKLEIALKEASETGYWLELLNRTNYIDGGQNQQKAV